VLVLFASVCRTHPEQLRCVERRIGGVERSGQVAANAAPSVADASNRAVGDAGGLSDSRRPAFALYVCVPVGSCVHVLTMRSALDAIMHNAYRSARGGRENSCSALSRSP